jgi:ribose transport system permease protein
VIIASVALYTWMQKKDRDGSGGVLSGLSTPEGQRMLRLTALILGLLIALVAIGAGLAVTPKASG